MCHVSAVIFGAANMLPNEIIDKKVIEVGSYDVNGSLRHIYKKWQPSEYVGVDIEHGPGVDIICNAEELIDRFGKNRFDVVISTELLEHVKDWRRVISNLKNICKPKGIMLITTRAMGFPFHGYPQDFWRYEIEDIERIFNDCNIEILERDWEFPGIFLKARKPIAFIENDLSKIKLFSVAEENRVIEIDDHRYNNFLQYQRRKEFIRKMEKKFFKIN